MLDINATAEYLGTSRRHVQRLIADRRLTHVKIGGRVRFRQQDLDAYVVAQTVPAVAR